VGKVKMMKTPLIKLLILFLIVFSIGSCSDPIFYKVTEEVPLLDPLIGGSPVNFVIFKNNMYVASGKKIFIFAQNSNNWTKWKELGAFVTRLAVTEAASPADSSLYALYLDGNNGKIKRYYNNGNSSVDLALPYNVQSIYALENILFICSRNNNTYTIYYLDEDNPSQGVKEITGTNSYFVLNGAVSDPSYYYLCTYSGIFCVPIDPLSLSAQSEVLGSNLGFNGIIKLNDDYSAAICNNGDLYEITGATITKVAGFDDTRYSTGALALWKRNKDDPPSLLLAGRKEYYYSTTTGYSNGYLEIELDDTGRIKPGAGFTEPGKNALSSIENNDRYSSTLGEKAINYIIQTPADINEKMILFASTQKDGVWSYRERKEGVLWNAEE
jgi:hypothetical protein